MPLRHVVLLKFKADVNAEQKSALTEALSKLPSVISGLSHYHVGADAGLDPARNHDFAIVADFPSEREYQVYAQHPAHQEVIQKFVKPLLAEGGRTAVQYSVPSSLPEQCAIEVPWSRKSMTEFRQALCQPDFAFSQTLAFIDEHFNYTPKRFVNGKEESAAGANIGSCKLLSFGKLVHLSELELLTAFGEHYREVRSNPEGTSHANIRALIVHGWSEVKFPDGLAISVKGLPELQGFRRELCNPEFVFSKTLAFIDEHFEYTPKPFVNGGAESAADANVGSCKLLSFGKIVGLSELELLAAFGEHHRQVRGEPDGTSHGNIRAFIAQGWNGVKFPEGIGLAIKASSKRRKTA